MSQRPKLNRTLKPIGMAAAAVAAPRAALTTVTTARGAYRAAPVAEGAEHLTTVTTAKGTTARGPKEDSRKAAARVLAQLAQRLGAQGAGFADMDSESDAEVDGGAMIPWPLAVGAKHPKGTRRSDSRDISQRRAIAEVNSARKLLGLKIKRSQAGPGDKRKIRGATISKLMKQGMSLPDASRHLAAHPELVR